MRSPPLPQAWALGVALAGLCHLAPRPAQAVEFTVRGVPVRLNITESFYFGYHSFAEPLSPGLGPPYGDPLNPFSGLLFCAGANDPGCERRQGFGNNRLPLTRTAKAGQNYFDLFNRLNLLLSVWRIQAGVRVDTSVFLNPPQPLDPLDPDAGGCGAACLSRFENRPVSPTGVEKVFLTYSDRQLELTLGDSYAVFGRGLVLGLRKVDELAIDTTILGAKLVYSPGPLKLSGVFGVGNVQNTDEATGRFQRDPFDVVLGLRGEGRLLDKVIIGVHAAGGVLARPRQQGGVFQTVFGEDADPTPCDPEHPERCGYSSGRLAYGVSLEAPRILPWLDAYVEGAGLEHFRDERLYPDRSPRGYALYGSLTGYFGPLTALFEWKQYSHFEPWAGTTQHPEFNNIAYNLPPTVERVLTEVEDPQTEIGGGRLLLTYRVGPALSLVVSEAAFRQERYGDLVNHALLIQDPYAGVQLRWQTGVSHLFVNGGYRLEYDTENEDVFKRTGWFDWDFIQGLPRNLSIESQGRALFRSRAGEPDWVEGNAYVALKWTPYLISALGLEWSTRGVTVNEEKMSYAQYGLFPNGFVQYNITTRSSIRFFAGGQRGGLKCISGICRVYPDMRGARLDVVLRF